MYWTIVERIRHALSLGFYMAEIRELVRDLSEADFYAHYQAAQEFLTDGIYSPYRPLTSCENS